MSLIKLCTQIYFIFASGNVALKAASQAVFLLYLQMTIWQLTKLYATSPQFFPYIIWIEIIMSSNNQVHFFPKQLFIVLNKLCCDEKYI